MRKHQRSEASTTDIFSHSSGGWKSRTKLSAGLVSSEASLFDWSTSPSVCVLIASSLCVCVSQSPLLVGVPVVLD